jgi:hypothetical protein
MTPNELKSLYEDLIDDTNLSQSSVFTFFNNSFNAIWIKRPWEIAKKSDDTKTTSVGVTYVALPFKFLKPLPIWIGSTQILPIKREDRRLFKDSAFRYYVDWQTLTIKLTYSPTSAETIYWDYIYEPDNAFTVTLEDTDLETTIPGFKKAFHPLVAYEAAKMFYYQEVGSKNDSWTAEMEVEYQRLYNLMATWDAELKMSAQNTSIPDLMSYGNYRSDVIELSE